LELHEAGVEVVVVINAKTRRTLGVTVPQSLLDGEEIQ